MAGSVHPCFCPCPFFVLCFVFSGPRLHPWQKESRNLTKVSPPQRPPLHMDGGGSLDPPGDGWEGLVPSQVCWGLGGEGAQESGDLERKR